MVKFVSKVLTLVHAGRLSVSAVLLFADAGGAASPGAIDGGDTNAHTELVVNLLLDFINRSQSLARATVFGYLAGKATAGTELPRSTLTLRLCFCFAFSLTLALKVVVVAVARAELATNRFGHKAVLASDAGLLFERSRFLGGDSLDGPGVGNTGIVQ